MPRFAKVISDGLNLRSKPKVDKTNIVDKLNQYDRLEIVGPQLMNGWIYVRVIRTGQSGYVFGQYIEVEMPLPPPVHVEEAPSLVLPIIAGVGLIVILGVLLMVSL